METDIHKNPGMHPQNEVVTLRIRTETGKRTLLLKLHISDKISTVYKWVKPYIEERDRKFVVRTNFPNKVYDEVDPRSLKELGLYPSCALVI